MKVAYHISKRAKIAMLLMTVASLIGFTEVSVSDILCDKVVISIHNANDNHFVSERDILESIEKENSNLVGRPFSELDLKSMERAVLLNKYIESCDIFKDIKGVLYIRTFLRRPMARIVQKNGPGAYITAKGEIIPLSENYSARVLIISGDYAKYLLSTDFEGFSKHNSFLEMINFINNDSFWSAQIAQLDINKWGNIIMLPQVTRQQIDFGSAEGYEQKFKKLTLFYKEILPRQGWNAYTRVNVKFDNQIIAEKPQ